ncbi:excinuclease ABC subunit UvrA [Aureicoccus marinus]|uniref:UvrABC system protein A n=1 Tax=Aureicoccus marinus TaxID=754435 RepID=A0A2S7T6K5_9FLAO|nr:excinuclease ABC subunit UvrA [Aureicoccus marinus]PQJ15086.1 excinuclease ABC subunit A [Aureicoccus marinus]
MTTLADIDPKTHILIQGARLHNLKNIDLAIPRNQLVVITGLSGSGKSSLAFDTLYAEGQRRYVESLSSYARQFLGKLDKPQVDSIKGIAPAIAIEQKVNTTNPRSTVGTTTEIYDYLKLLFARVGKTYSPISGNEVKKHMVSDVIDQVKTFEAGIRLLLLAPIQVPEDREPIKVAQLFSKQGYARLKFRDNVYRIDQVPEDLGRSFELIVDRIVVKQEDDDFYNRLGQAVDNAFFEGKGHCSLEEVDSGDRISFSNLFELDGMSFLENNTHLFSFNNPYGACPKCEGYGDVIGIDEDLVIPNTALSIYENAVFPWRGESMSWYRDQLVDSAYKFDFPIHKPWFELSEEQKQLVWEGNNHFIGIRKFFTQLEEKSYKIQNRVLLSRYRGKTKCDVCQGTRLRKEAAYVKIGGKSLSELVDLPITALQEFFQDLTFSDYEQKVAKRLLIEINNRISYLIRVGLGYLSINRKSNTLSGGESQRINLATSLGSSLVGSLYILDEPSIGLHPKDTENLISVLVDLRDLGNTVIVVEHDEEIMRAADHIIDIGPEAGTLGGEVVAEGTIKDIMKSDSLTSSYLNGTLEIPLPTKRRNLKKSIRIRGAREHNLKNIDVQFPLQGLTVVTGVSGSGKSTLVRKILYPALLKEIGGYGDRPGQHSRIEGDISAIQQLEFVDQNPIGRSSRSNPVTYIKAYDDIRALYSSQKLAELRGYKPKHFSFNVDGGRCENCKGEGQITIEMQFMADVHLDCDVCKGTRFKKEVLEVTYEGINISQLLDMTIDDALRFFKEHQQKKLVQKLQPLQDVGLGYVTLGQSSATLSGGEAQRIKLASFLVKGHQSDKTLFIFDEPTTGLHFHDILKLLKSFEALIEKGHSILVIEHNIDLIKCADYIVDLGPEGGQNGGYLSAAGTPEEVAKIKDSHTGNYLAEKLTS